MSAPQPPAIHLRAFTTADADFLAALASDPRVTSHIGDGQPWEPGVIAARITAALGHLPVELDGSARWFMAEAAGQPVGFLAATRRRERVEIGYWVAPKHWGRGLAGAILDRAPELVQQTFGTSCLLARVDPDNVASVRVLARRGFEPAGSDAGLDHYHLG